MKRAPLGILDRLLMLGVRFSDPTDARWARRMTMFVLGPIIAAMALLTLAFAASAQEANPKTTAAPPWPIDQRCAPIAGHTAAAHRAYLNCAAIESTLKRIEQDQVQVHRHRSTHTNTQGSRSRGEQPETPPNRE